jgi:hypothetical protein
MLQSDGTNAAISAIKFFFYFFEIMNLVELKSF